MLRIISFLIGLLLTGGGYAADKELWFGQTAVLEGPAAALGNNMRLGILAAFQEANDQGGVQGYLLKLKSLNDNYEPVQAIANTKSLLNDDKIFALIGSVGTPTANAIVPILTKAQVPLIGPFTGAEFLRSPYNPYIINIRASYWEEAEAWAKYLVDEKNYHRIAILFQDDSFGRAGLTGIQQALHKRDMELVAEGTYLRNTTAIKTALLKIRKKDPQAVVIVGAYKPAAEFIKLAKELELNVEFINISFVGTEALLEALGSDKEGVIISEVVPSPNYSKLQIVRDYQQAFTKYFPDANFNYVSLEGYIAARLNIEILKQIPTEITVENYLETLYSKGEFKIGELKLEFGKHDNQGLNKVFLIKFEKDRNIEINTFNVGHDEAR